MPHGRRAPGSAKRIRRSGKKKTKFEINLAAGKKKAVRRHARAIGPKQRRRPRSRLASIRKRRA